MNNIQYKKFVKFYNNLIIKNLSYFTLAISSLCIIRSHYDYFDISKRKIEKQRPNFLFDYINQNLNFFKKKKFQQSDILFISVENKNSKKDLFFEKIIKYFQFKNTSYCVLTRSFSNSENSSQQTRKNFFLLKNKRNLFLDIFYLTILILNIIRIGINNKKSISVKIKTILNLLSFKNLKSSLYNLNHVNSIIAEIKKIKPKKVIFTYEGYPWERMLNYKIKKFDKSIATYGYFFSIVSKYHNSPFVRLNKYFDPDYILCAGNFAKKTFINKKFRTNNIITIGHSNLNLDSYKSKKNFDKKNCLILPEGLNDEVIYLIDYAKNILAKNIDINFILRLHPSTTREFKEYIKFCIKYSKIKLSKFTLDEDLKRSKIAIYRGSSAIIGACFANIIPVYVSKPNELSIDPLFAISKAKPKINSANEFIKFYNQLNKDQFIYNKKKMDKVQDFCRKYFLDINYHQLNKLFLS